MTTNFEDIEINDATATPRKVAGQFVDQGGDNLFHQTAIPVGSRIDSDNIASLTSTATVITLSGFETHVILEFNTGITQEVEIGLRYFAGGRTYPVDWRMHYSQYNQVGGIAAAVPEDFARIPESNVSFSTGEEGSGLLFIPTRGAVEMSIATNSGTITDVDWATVTAPIETHPFGSFTQVKNRGFRQADVNPQAQPYADGDAVGDVMEPYIKDVYLTTTGTPTLTAVPVITSIRYHSGLATGPVTYDMPDFDLILFEANESPSTTDGAAFTMTSSEARNILAVLEFRESPGEGQYRCSDSGRGFLGYAGNLNIPVFGLTDTGFGYAHLCDMVMVYRGGTPLATNSINFEGPQFRYTYDLS